MLAIRNAAAKCDQNNVDPDYMAYISFAGSGSDHYIMFIYSLKGEGAQRGGGTLIFSYIRRLGSFFGVNILNFNIFGDFQKYKYFSGYEDFVDIFLVNTKLDYI